MKEELKGTVLPYFENSRHWEFIDARAQAARSTQTVQPPATGVQHGNEAELVAQVQKKAAEVASLSALLSAQEKVPCYFCCSHINFLQKAEKQNAEVQELRKLVEERAKEQKSKFLWCVNVVSLHLL